MTESRCPKCGATLDESHVRAGTCPSCLLELALIPASDVPTEDEPTLWPDRAELGAGVRVGPYKIDRKLGEGGMGIVYLAEQEEPLRRVVALKVIKRGMDTRQVVARFEAERQALALMDHEAIAKVFEAGETAGGRPYFAMEYVDGKPITEYCDDRRLNTRKRLELFIKVCDGVQHAHQRGIIHRDIKPSNVLVVERDEGPTPKIIDFGVAKAIEQRITERSLFTELGVLIGTPEYMSPEQADMAPLDVDTRTDVYSLGVLFYELLTGALPFDPQELRRAAFDEIRRKIREDRPSKPSLRISELGERASRSAQRRRTDAATLRRQLSDDLDVITMKALEKDRALRYGSPAELGADIRRHLNGEPVLAQPPSAFYQIRKLIARHKLPAVLVALFLVALVGFGVGMSVLYARAVAAETAAAQEAETLRQVSDFMIGVFRVSDPSEARGNKVTARELLDEAAQTITEELDDQPTVRATLMETMGNAYESLGLYDQAASLLEDSLAQREAAADGDDPELARTLGSLATIYYYQGRYDDTEALARRALGIQERALGPDHLEVATTLEILASIHWQRGEYEDALSPTTRSVEIRENALGPEDPEVAQGLNSLGNLYLAMGRHDDAESLLERALEIREKAFGPDHPGVATVANNLAETYSRQGRYEEAEPLFLRVLAIRDKIYESDHPTMAYSHNNLGALYVRQGRFAEAAERYKRALEIREAALPADHPLIAWTSDNLGVAYSNLGSYDAAGAAFERARDIARKTVGEDSPDFAVVLTNLARLRIKQQRLADAETLLRQANDIREKSLDDDHPALAYGYHDLGEVYRKAGRVDEAESYYRRALDIREKSLGTDHRETESTRKALAELLCQLGRGDEADGL
jgi:serine/threonine protein kinase/tetratricopeptide (TPR) repeat protein